MTPGAAPISLVSDTFDCGVVTPLPRPRIPGIEGVVQSDANDLDEVAQSRTLECRVRGGAGPSRDGHHEIEFTRGRVARFDDEPLTRSRQEVAKQGPARAGESALDETIDICIPCTFVVVRKDDWNLGCASFR